MATFTVDTHLFRELGELLVGRDSTALIELIKNSYDADATEIVVSGEYLSDRERGIIRLVDDGVGMTLATFQRGFLRIASRTKDEGDRRSVLYQRRYTGAKGIGRLAAHKLAHRVSILSIPAPLDSATRHGVDATIDWDQVEEYETLEQLDGTDAVVVNDVPSSGGRRGGTTILLERLRRDWTEREHSRFLEEVQTFQPPSILVSPVPQSVLRDALLFEQPLVRDSTSAGDPGFVVRLIGDLAPSEDYWAAATNAADWVIEIDASPSGVRYGIAPTIRAQKELPAAERRVFVVEHPSPQDGPFFQARILLRTGAKMGAKQQRMWAARNSGVRIFMEGFRVLPYGEAENDWLSLDRDYVQRSRDVFARSAGLLASAYADFAEEEGLLHLPQKHYFGAVFLTQERAGSLNMLVNREGFVPNGTYERLVTMVRAGIDLATRTRGAATVEIRANRREQRARIRAGAGRDGADEEISTATAVRIVVEEAKSLASRARTLAASGEMAKAQEVFAEAVARITDVSDVSSDLLSEASMLRVLASVGTQFAGFIHEINALLGAAQAIERALGEFRDRAVESVDTRQRLTQLHRAAGDLRRQLERQASYLVDVVSPDARRRRSRQPLAERFDAAARLVLHVAERQGVTIENAIPPTFKSPPMFPAEITAVFSNLLTNAIKAAGSHGRIAASAEARPDGAIVVRIQNTGVAVRPEDGERWFRPFESSTVHVDAVLGQGMGLGLPITRTILEEYGAELQFAHPQDEFATSLEITLPE